LVLSVLGPFLVPDRPSSLVVLRPWFLVFHQGPGTRHENGPGTKDKAPGTQDGRILICGSYNRVPRHAGHFPGLESLSSSKVNPQERHFAGTTRIWWPAALAERSA